MISCLNHLVSFFSNLLHSTSTFIHFPNMYLSACAFRYTYLRCMIEKQLGCLPEGAMCRWSAPQPVQTLPQKIISSTQWRQREWPAIFLHPHIIQSVSIQSQFIVCSLVKCLESVPVTICALIHFIITHSMQKKDVLLPWNRMSTKTGFLLMSKNNWKHKMFSKIVQVKCLLKHFSKHKNKFRWCHIDVKLARICRNNHLLHFTIAVYSGG